MSFLRASARSRALTTLGLVLGLGALVIGHVPLINPSNSEELHWTASEVSVVIQENGSDDVDDGSHFPALRNSISAWNGATGNDITLVEDSSASQQSRVDWQSSSVHLLYFDETNTSGYFPSGAGIVAVTPIFFTSNGRIVDADVLFNGRGFRFTTSGTSGAFDISDVATHEIGHLLGLDHSGWAGASMYPYVDPLVILHRSLSLDDVHGLRDAYPTGGFGRIRGRVIRAQDDSNVAGAHVVARNSEGRPVAGTLSGSNGVFRLKGLDPGEYEVYASPLGQPVSAANLGSGWDIDTDFQSTILGSISVTTGESDMENVSVGVDVDVSLGRSSDDFPKRVLIGEESSLNLRGSSLSSGGTLTCSDPDIEVTVEALLGIVVSFTLTVPPGTTPGHADLMFTTSEGDRTILTAGIELTPPDPSVSIVSPASGLNGGGSALTIVGSGFRAGARVVIGDSLYQDGVDGCEVIDSETITLTTTEMVGGLHDVVVIDPTGIEGRLASGFQATAIPALALVFPAVGSSEGGTVLHMTGSDFVAGMTVNIDGIFQPGVQVDSPSEARVTTLSASSSGPLILTVTNPAGAQSTAAFTYLDNPDPKITSLSPDAGPKKGGTEVVISGSNFDDSISVLFGADGMTGEGGAEVADVLLLDSSTLLVTTPSGSTGLADVVLVNPETGQAASLASAFEYEGSNSSNGTDVSVFGSCLSVASPRDMSPLDIVLASSWLWIAIALAVAQWRLSLRRLRSQARSVPID